MAQQNAELLQILICQLGENVNLDSVLDKSFRVLGQVEFFEPIRNLLHRDRQQSRPDDQSFHHGKQSLH